MLNVARKISRIARRAGDDDGAALVELGMSVPLLVLTSMLAMAVMTIIQAQFAVQSATREAAMVGAQVGSSLDPYTKSTEAARFEALRLIEEYDLILERATIDFTGTPEEMHRGGLFVVTITYDVHIPAPTVKFFEMALGEAGIFTVESRAAIPIQKHKARWPCPSPHPLCS